MSISIQWSIFSVPKVLIYRKHDVEKIVLKLLDYTGLPRKVFPEFCPRAIQRPLQAPSKCAWLLFSQQQALALVFQVCWTHELWMESQPTQDKGGGLLLKTKATILVNSVSTGLREHSGSFSFLEFPVLS